MSERRPRKVRVTKADRERAQRAWDDYLFDMREKAFVELVARAIAEARADAQTA